MATHSSTLAWKIPWVEEPGRLQSMELLTVWHDWATLLSLFTFMHWRRKLQLTPGFFPGEYQGRRSLVGCRLWGHTESDTAERLIWSDDPAIPLLSIHTEETRIERDTCTPVFITALFTIARTWRQPRCPSADEWIGKLWYIYTMEYYSAIKKNTFESVLMRWMNLEPIIQSEVSQKEKHQYNMLTQIYGI